MTNKLNNDKAVLADYSFHLFNSKNKNVLAIKKVNGKQQLTTLAKKDITCWEVFKSLFGFGKLAHFHYSLNSVTKYLNNSHNWKAFSKQDVSSQEYKAYLTVCEVAKRSLLKNNDTSLWNKVSFKKEYSYMNMAEKVTMQCQILINPTLDAHVLYHLMKITFLGDKINHPNFGCNFNIYEQVGMQNSKPIYKVLSNDRTIKIKEENLGKTLVKLFGCYTVQLANS